MELSGPHALRATSATNALSNPRALRLSEPRFKAPSPQVLADGLDLCRNWKTATPKGWNCLARKWFDHKKATSRTPDKKMSIQSLSSSPTNS